MRVGLAVLRALIFTAGLIFGVAISLNAGVSGGGGGPTIVRLVVILLPLALGLAAPVAWVLAARSQDGDRWTIAYAVGWLLFLGIGSLLVVIF